MFLLLCLCWVKWPEQQYLDEKTRIFSPQMPSPAPLGDHRGDPYLGGVIPPSWPGSSPEQTDPERLTGGFLTRCLNLHRCSEEVWAQLNPIQLSYWTQWLNIKTLIWQHRILVPLHVDVWPGCFCLLSRIFLSPAVWLKLFTGLESSCFYSFYRPWPLWQEGTNTKYKCLYSKTERLACW